MAGKKMEFDPEEQQIIELLTKLKDRGGNYPKKLWASRRQTFLSQMASVGLGLGIGEGIKAAVKPSKGGAVSHLSGLSASSVIESVLVLAIVVQASVIAYTYRDKIVDLVNTLSASSISIPTDVSNPVSGSPATEPVASGTPTPTITETPTVSPSPSSTVTTAPSASNDNGVDAGNSSNNTNSPAVTPQPTNGNNGNNGNHYGQTPKPPQEKTNPKATQGTGGGNGGGNGNGTGNGGKKP